ncbi:hypothetical protein PF003_g36457 [Phytophthora fragariae]|nr:hypothetical protein PF003_g36457 [Phytophthora fragariae]
MWTTEPRTVPGKDPGQSPEVQDARPRTRELRKPHRRAEKERLEERRRADETRSRVPQYAGAVAVGKPRRGRPEHSEGQARRTSKHQDDRDMKSHTHLAGAAQGPEGTRGGRSQRPRLWAIRGARHCTAPFTSARFTTRRGQLWRGDPAEK